MKVKIKRFDKTLPLPEYKTPGAACIDLYTRETTIIKPKEIKYIPLNVALEVPSNCFVLCVPRSSAHKLGIMQANNIGIGDSDYCGDNDEYKFAAYNYTEQEITIERGTRLAQMLILNYQQIEMEEVEQLHNQNRSGFGSTGLK